MPAVDTQHPSYHRAQSKWKLVRDCIEGEERVKERGRDYLPLLSDQSTPAYEAYKQRAQFIETTKQTHEAVVGYIFRKDPQYIFDDVLASFMDDSTLSALSFYDWLKDTARAVAGVGRRGTLIEWNEELARPFLVPFEAEDIWNWKTRLIEGRLVLSLLVLREDSTKWYDSDDGTELPDSFVHQTWEQWRVYEILNDETGLPYVRCQIWRRKTVSGATKPPDIAIPGTGPGPGTVNSGSDGNWRMVEETFPHRMMQTLARIPFVFHGPNNFLPDIDRCPMESIARINISQYRTSADLENGLHFSGLPQMAVKGYGEDAAKLPIGQNQAWVSDKDWADAKYVEVSGGFEGLVAAFDRKQKQMEAQGARVFDASSSKGAEAYDTVRIRQTGETVTLTNIAIAMTQSASKVIQWVAWWMTRSAQNPEDLADRASVDMNTDFVEVEIPSDKMSALKELWMSRAISHKALFWNLQKGEMYPPDTDYDTELQQIQEDDVIGLGIQDQLAAQPQDFGGGAPAPVDNSGGSDTTAQTKSQQ